jgi:hypothetical protein
MQLALIVLLDLGLLAFAWRRPWVGFVVLLAVLPFNGFLGDVAAPTLGLASVETTALLAWHDALAFGIALAAATQFLRRKVGSPGLVEWLAALMLAAGLLGVVISPFRLTAIYEYRTLYFPPVLALSLLFLWRAGTMPHGLHLRAARVMIGSGTVAAMFAFWQVYVGGKGLLGHYFRTGDGRIPAAYFTAFVDQPRAFGTFHSPNEFGAYLAVVVCLLAVPGLVSIRSQVRPWLLVPLGLALLLTFSRSAWATTAVMVMIVGLARWPGRRWLRTRPAALHDRASWTRYGLPAVVFLAAASVILVSSGGYAFVSATVSGNEPSAAYHMDLLGNIVGTAAGGADSGSSSGVTDLQPRVSPLGMGLGTAGPKSARFGESGSGPLISSEIWYVNYLYQTGWLGLVILALFVLSIAARLWRSRSAPWPLAALAVGTGLAVGALGIPVIDEPAVAIPLWSVIGLGLIHAELGRRPAVRSATADVAVT